MQIAKTTVCISKAKHLTGAYTMLNRFTLREYGHLKFSPMVAMYLTADKAENTITK